MVEKDSNKKATCNENDKQNDNGKATIKLDDKGRTSWKQFTSNVVFQQMML